MQPFIEAPTLRCCSCSKSAAKTPASVALFIDSRKIYADVAEPPAPLILLFYQVEIRLIQFFHRKSLTRSQLITAVTVQRDCGNCRVVR